MKMKLRCFNTYIIWIILTESADSSLLQSNLICPTIIHELQDYVSDYVINI
jgi:hypothetical protein